MHWSTADTSPKFKHFLHEINISYKKRYDWKQQQRKQYCCSVEVSTTMGHSIPWEGKSHSQIRHLLSIQKVHYRVHNCPPPVHILTTWLKTHTFFMQHSSPAYSSLRVLLLKSGLICVLHILRISPPSFYQSTNIWEMALSVEILMILIPTIK